MEFARHVMVRSGGLVAAAIGGCTLWAAAMFSVSAAQAPAAVPGLMVTYRQAGSAAAVDVLPTPRVALYVGEGQAATPFVAPGAFTAEFDGFVSVDLRDDYQFRAEVRGSVEVRVGNVVVLSASADGRETAASKPVRLNRGANPLRVTYTSPDKGDSFVRLFWSSADLAWEPVPSVALTRPAESAPLRTAQLARDGRALFLEYRCVQCHRSAATVSSDALLDAPSFADIGARLNARWIAQWVEDPGRLRPEARMPRVVHGAGAASEAGDLAAFLATIGTRAPAPATASPDDVAGGEQGFEMLKCATCHVTSGTPPPGKISLARVRDKFAPGALAAFLKQPNRHYAWIRMPDFGLADVEANALAAWLETIAPATAPSPDQPAGDATRGKTLVQRRGCLSCHAMDLPNEFKASGLAELPTPTWASTWHGPDSTSVSYNLTADERTALRAFAATDRRSLERSAPAAFATAAVDKLNCQGCHGQIERVPLLDVVGGKLRPEWSRSLIEGTLGYKPRPWIEARMPAFPR